MIETNIENYEIVQVFNPVSHKYIKIDTVNASILSHGKKDGTPYKNIPIVNHKDKQWNSG